MDKGSPVPVPGDLDERQSGVHGGPREAMHRTKVGAETLRVSERGVFDLSLVNAAFVVPQQLHR